MSLNSLATSRVARKMSRGRSLAFGSEDAVGPREEDVQNAISSLIEYVPAETITLYLAAIAALPVLMDVSPWFTATKVYGFFGGLTPVLFALIFMGKQRAVGEPRWPGLKEFPFWPMIAATIAFFAWGLAVPDGPFLDSESGRAISGLIAIIVSTFLGVLGRLFIPKPQENIDSK